MLTLIEILKYVYNILTLWQGIRHREEAGKFNIALKIMIRFHITVFTEESSADEVEC
jgi:hypothetical protein